MRKIALASIVALLVVTGFAASGPRVATAASSEPKVVIIVGPVGSQTSYYHSAADEAAAAAAQYTSNVVKVYSPNATWAQAKAALQGANVVIYMGHGNGFPSPYRTSPWPYSQNGLGLNPVAGANDSTVQYYGEFYLTNYVRLAPNAVVIINFACYSAGNSEPGYPEPSLSVAQQRVDNFGAGWLSTGARSVIAEAHSGAAYYVNALFSSHQTIEQLWRAAPTFHGNLVGFASSRTPGMAAQMDLETPTGGYWRSIIGDMSVTTDAITGARFGNTGGDPTAFVVPGNAEVVGAAGLYADPGLAANPGAAQALAVLPIGSRLHLLSQAGTGPDGSAVFQASTVDGATSGFVSAGGLAPRDSIPPQVLGLGGDDVISPNGDGRSDNAAISGRLSEQATWQVTFHGPGGTIAAVQSGAGDTFAATWDGRSGGVPVPDGTYTYDVQATDSWGNGPTTAQGRVVVDTVPSQFRGAVGSGSSPTFSPNGDGLQDKLALKFATTEIGTVDASIRDAAGSLVRSLTAKASATAGATGGGTVTWSGESDAGPIVPDGRYTLTLTPRDLAANAGVSQTIVVTVFAALANVRASAPVLFPQDGDPLGASVQLGYELRAAAVTTWSITDAGGRAVRALQAASQLGAGSYSATWDGRDDGGALLPVGTYYSLVSAASGSLSIRSRVAIVMGAFKVVTSTKAPARGHSLVVTATTAEPLAGAPRLTIAQPGWGAWAVALSRVSATVYRATIRMKTGGTAGSVALTVSGQDVGGGANSSQLILPLR